MEPARLGDRVIEHPFTIPSGIVTTTPDILRLFAEEIPELGILITKSIGPRPRAGNETPIFAERSCGSYQNAVGLTNPGYEAFREEMEGVYPTVRDSGTFLLTSIFGENAEEFREVAEGLRDVTDGYELNFSCPHAEKVGSAVGSDQELAVGIVKSVKAIAKEKPVLVKVSPRFPRLGDYARTMVEAGADGITAINTDGPETSDVISIGKGGVSGREIKGLGIECVRNIRQAIGSRYPIITMGGIASAEDARAYQKAGGSIFGIGSALTAMPTARIKEYFAALEQDLAAGSNGAAALLIGNQLMQYSPFTIARVETLASDLKVLYFKEPLPAEPGQFVFTWINGEGERPFSIADDKPFTLAVKLKRGPGGEPGKHTSALLKLEAGDTLQVRGPYGNAFPKVNNEVVLVGGGTGVAPLHFYAKRYGESTEESSMVIIGGRSRDQLLFTRELGDYAGLRIATDDGSYGLKGTAIDALVRYFGEGRGEEAHFLNCGPEKMMAMAVALERRHTPDDRIYASLERIMKCGVGVSGSCSYNGYRVCVDGPVFSGEGLNGDFDRFERDKTGARVVI